MKKIFAAFLLLLISLPSFALTIAQQADSAYNAEDYSRAIALYNESIEKEGRSADVYYNLGNAYYRADKPGMAVVSYERALRLDPSGDDIRTNLEFVRSHIADKPEDDTAFFASLHRSVVCAMSANAWAWTAFAIFVLLMAATATYIFSTNVVLRKVSFFGGIVLIFVFLYVLLVASDSKERATSHDDAVVIVPNTQLTSAPRASRGADKVVTIHEGTVVEVVDSVATPDDPQSPMWYNVKINNNTKAWLRSSDVERI